MIRRWGFGVVLAVVAPLAVRGQGVNGATGPGRMGESTRSIFAQRAVTSDTVEKLNPVSMLLERRRDLGLTTAQVTQLGGVLARLDVRSMPLLRQLDSITKSMHMPVEGASDSPTPDRQQTQLYQSAITPVLNAVRGIDDSVNTEMLNVLTSDQRKKAADILRDQRRGLPDCCVPRGAGCRG